MLYILKKVKTKSTRIGNELEYPQKQMNLNTFQMSNIIILNDEEKIK